MKTGTCQEMWGDVDMEDVDDSEHEDSSDQEAELATAGEPVDLRVGHVCRLASMDAVMQAARASSVIGPPATFGRRQWNI